jgi:uncharacterized alpha/beta hydrolase family protein
MKKIFATTAAELILISIVDTAFATQAVVAEPVPFKGSIQAVETLEIITPTIFVKGTGSGNATQSN